MQAQYYVIQQTNQKTGELENSIDINKAPMPML